MLLSLWNCFCIKYVKPHLDVAIFRFMRKTGFCFHNRLTSKIGTGIDLKIFCLKESFEFFHDFQEFKFFEISQFISIYCDCHQFILYYRIQTQKMFIPWNDITVIFNFKWIVVHWPIYRSNWTGVSYISPPCMTHSHGNVKISLWYWKWLAKLQTIYLSLVNC